MSLVVLCVFDNNEFGNLPLLKQEEKDVDSIFQPLEKSDTQLNYISKSNLDLEALMQLIRDNQDELFWFHFSGHHDSESGIRMTDGGFMSLAETLKTCPNLKGVFINGCSSKETIDTLIDHVPICIGTVEPVYDSIAARFSEVFYKNLTAITEWKDYDHIHESFELSLAQVWDLLASKSIEETTRGVGSPESFKSDFYFISDHEPSEKEKFYCGSMFSAYNMNQYNSEGGFQNFMSELAGGRERAGSYWNLPPFPFGNIIKAFDVESRNENFDKYRELGQDRSRLIKNYFYTYFDLCKYCILSILWDEIIKKSNKIPNESIYDLLISPNVNENHVNILSDLCELILTTDSELREKRYVDKLKESLDMLKTGISLFETQGTDDSIHWKAELLLHALLDKSKYLNQYRIQSVRARYYVRHRNDEKEQYSLQFSNRKNELQEVTETEVNKKFVNIHSLYLCEIHDENDIVINLSPFYFDRNSHDSNAAKIKLFAFDRTQYNENSELFFNYLPLYNPLQASSSMSNLNIAIGKEEISSEQLLNIESTEDKDRLKKELNALDINKIYEQFISLFNAITQQHA